MLCASSEKRPGNGGVGGWGVGEDWNGVGGVLVPGCELGDSLPIS